MCGLNFHQGKEIIQYYIDELISEGVGVLPRFEDSTGKPRSKTLNEPLTANEGNESLETSNCEEDNSEEVEGATLVRKNNRQPLSHNLYHLCMFLFHFFHTPCKVALLALKGLLKGCIFSCLSFVHVLQNLILMLLNLDPESKIDDEYIHRYLGPLTPTEENALIQVGTCT